ncbi:hypothetical protein AGR1C_Lc50045 [Agrobacterium fabacearum TT111]|nr:hypothetical protein AGR1C_Lc50045 [Agrobacterium fabacearum TT111]
MRRCAHWPPLSGNIDRDCERHPVGAQVLDWSRAQVALMRPSRSTRALEAIIRDLIETRDGYIFRRARMGHFPPLRARRQPSAGGLQRSGLRTGGREEDRRTSERGQRTAFEF